MQIITEATEVKPDAAPARPAPAAPTTAAGLPTGGRTPDGPDPDWEALFAAAIRRDLAGAGCRPAWRR